MLLGRLVLPGRDLVLTQRGQDLAALLLAGRFGERSAQPRGGRLRGAAPRGAHGGRPEDLDPALIPVGVGQEQVCGEPLRRSALLRQRFGGGSVSRLAFAGREILVQRRAHDRMDEPQPRGTREDVSADEVIGRRTGSVVAQARHASGELEIAVVTEHGDRSRQLARRRSERGQPVQHEAAHGGGPDRLHLARGRSRRLDPRRVEGSEQLTQEQRIAARRRMTCAAELVRRLRAQALPRQGCRGGLAQRSRVQRDR